MHGILNVLHKQLIIDRRNRHAELGRKYRKPKRAFCRQAGELFAVVFYLPH